MKKKEYLKKLRKCLCNGLSYFLFKERIDTCCWYGTIYNDISSVPKVTIITIDGKYIYLCIRLNWGILSIRMSSIKLY